MSRPRIMIADTDVNYILSLQLKFVEDFFDKIDLEMITDGNYFDQIFSNPQKAEILIVSEELYDSSIQKHNISNVFVMTEQYEEDRTADLNVTRIFKYTSIKEIFNEILGKSSDALNIESAAKQETQIIVVTSATGGVGKTTVAMGISACLAKNYKRVLYMNADQLQVFQFLLQNDSPITSADVYSKLMKAGENAYQEVKHLIRSEVFYYLPPFKAALMSLGLTSDIFMKIAKAAKKSGDYDFIVIDTDSVFDERKAMFLELADKVIFVTRQGRASVLATNLLVSNINGVNDEKYSYICNDFDKNVDNAFISPSYSLKFVINEYIEHVPNYDQIKGSELAGYTSFQKAAYLYI